MYEYEIMNKVTGEQTFIYGYNWNNAMARNPHLDFNDWTCLSWEMID